MDGPSSCSLFRSTHRLTSSRRPPCSTQERAYAPGLAFDNPPRRALRHSRDFPRVLLRHLHSQARCPQYQTPYTHHTDTLSEASRQPSARPAAPRRLGSHVSLLTAASFSRGKALGLVLGVTGTSFGLCVTGVASSREREAVCRRTMWMCRTLVLPDTLRLAHGSSVMPHSER